MAPGEELEVTSVNRPAVRLGLGLTVRYSEFDFGPHRGRVCFLPPSLLPALLLLLIPPFLLLLLLLGL